MYKESYKQAETYEDLRMCFAIRSIVFIEEQNCPFAEEFDDQDETATHFIVTIDGEPACTARYYEVDGHAKFGRLAVRQGYRKLGLGKGMLSYVLKHIDTTGYTETVIHAQSYLVKFYEEFGFIKEGEEFMEAGIKHYYMTRSTS